MMKKNAINGKYTYSFMLGILLGLMCVHNSAMAVPPPGTSPGSSDAGAQLNRARENMERERVARQIAEDRKRETPKVEGSEAVEEERQEGQVRFGLKQVITDDSEVLTRAEIDNITKEYIGKDVTIEDLYAIVSKLNQLYNDKGYYTCRSFLPPQSIQDGTVKINLLEGRTGLVKISGGKHTKDSYVRSQLSLKEGKINNIAALNSDMYRFNSGNNAQLRIEMKAGKEPGTTDYEITVFEPKRNSQFTVYADNAGSENTGLYRGGLFYSNRSLLGYRDELSLGYLYSGGLKSFSLGYSLPLGNKGTRLDLDYSTNSTEIIKGVLEPLGVKGHASSYGVTVRQPLMVNEKQRIEAGLRFEHQKSQTDFGTIQWIDDKTSRYYPYVALTHYGRSSVVYHKHSLGMTNWRGIAGVSQRSMNYKLNFLWQKQHEHGHMLQGRINAQVSNEDYLSSADRFYIGGAYSVRGYEESYLSGDKGYAAGLEYSIPLGKKKILSAFTFLDCGQVFGASSFDDHTLAGTGVGIRAAYKDVFASCTLGVPLIRNVNGTKESRARIHFVLSGTF